MYQALAASAREQYPEALVTSYLFQAGTDAGAWRTRGVPVYGIYPYPIDQEDLSRMHGNDERVSVQSLGEGTEMIYRVLVDGRQEALEKHSPRAERLAREGKTGGSRSRQICARDGKHNLSEFPMRFCRTCEAPFTR